MKKALVLAGGLPQIELIKELRSRGYIVVLADYNQNPIAKEYADYFYQKSTLDIEAIRKIARSEKVDLIITCCTDQALLIVAQLAEEMNLPCYIDAQTGLFVTNKAYMKEKFHEYGIPTASYKIIRNFQEKQQNNYPVIVKPVDCNSSKGVVKVRNEAELKIAVEKAIQYSRTNIAIVEEYIEGIEISVDLFVKDGKAKILCTSYTDKIQDEEKFVIYRGSYPAPLIDDDYRKIQKIADKIVIAFGLKNSPMLLQLLKREDEIYVIEFSARTGGCVKYHMIQMASGVNVIKATVDLFEGKKPNVTVHMSDKIIVDEFVYCKNGEFDFLTGFLDAKENGVIENVFLLKSSGEYLQGVNSSGDRIAAITYQADSYEDYVRKHNDLIGKIKVIDKEGKDIMRHDLLPHLAY